MQRLNLTGRGSLSAVLACAGAALVIFLVAGAAALGDTNCGPPATLSGSCFEAGDGNQLNGSGDLVDWQSLSVPPIVDAARGIDSKFKGGSKELEPGGWEFVTGNNTPKADLLDGWGTLQNGFLYAAFTRVKQQGDTYLAFELNQLPAGPRESGGIPVPQRSSGDVLITYDISTTNRISVGMCIWQGDSSSGDWMLLDGKTAVGGGVKACTQLDPTTNPAAMGAVNFGQPISAADNYLEDHSAGIGAGQFGEAAVNLNALPEGAGRFLANPCGPNGWFWMHSRSSDSVTSDPKDILAGAPISDPSCHLTLDKKVSLSGADGTFADAPQDNPLAAEVGDTLTYQVTVSNTGTAPLTVNLSDPLCDTGSLSGGPSGPLAAGASATYTCTHLVTANDPTPLVNTACATGMVGDTTIDDKPCDSTYVQVFQPGELAAANGTKFQDADGNGVHDAGEGPLAGFLFYVDYNGNSQLDPGEPAAVSGADGSWHILGIKPGAWTVREAADPNYTCTLPSPCSRDVAFGVGQTVDAGDWGNHPNAYQIPLATQQPAPGQLVLGARIAPGRAQLLGPTGCRARAFRARVTGTKIARVVFILDGRVVKTLTRTNFRKAFALRIDPARLSVGVHRLIAQVSFQRGSGTKPKQFRLTFQRCPRALRAPRFTG